MKQRVPRPIKVSDPDSAAGSEHKKEHLKFPHIRHKKVPAKFPTRKPGLFKHSMNEQKTPYGGSKLSIEPGKSYVSPYRKGLFKSVY